MDLRQTACSGPTPSHSSWLYPPRWAVTPPKFPDFYPLLNSAPIPWASNTSIARIHPMMVNAASPVKDAAIEFVTYMYKPDNYRAWWKGARM